MNLLKVLPWCTEGLESLQRLSVHVGEALARKDSHDLATVHRKVAEVQETHVLELKSFEAGYRLAVQDVLASYGAHVSTEPKPSAGTRLFHWALLEILGK